MTTVNDIFLESEEISAVMGAGSPSVGGEDMNTYLLSDIVDDKTYQIKTMATKARRQRKIQARSNRCVANDVAAACSALDPVVCLDRSLETISLDEFVGTARNRDSDELEDKESKLHDAGQTVFRTAPRSRLCVY